MGCQPRIAPSPRPTMLSRQETHNPCGAWMFGFVALLMALMCGLSAYLFKRTAALLRLGHRARVALVVGLCAALVTAFAAVLLDHALGHHRVLLPAMVACTVELAVVIAGPLLGVLQLAEGAWRLVRQMVSRSVLQAHVVTGFQAPLKAADEDPTTLSRRAFVSGASAGIALAAGAGAAGYGALIGRHDYVLEEVALPLAGLAPALDGLTLVQLSDLHVGIFVGERELLAAVELVQRAKPDLLVVTGDLVDHEVSYLPELGVFLQRLASLVQPGRLVVIPGNHDYYTGIQPTLATARAAGARVLCNDGIRVGDRSGGFALLGVDDVWAARRGGGPNLSQALAAVPDDLPRVLLCHNPSFFRRAAGHVAIQLSGHTHGGQVNVGLPLASLALPYGYVAGEYRRSGSRLYVNRGFGTSGPPARVGAPPEVTRIVLVAAS